MDVDLVFVAKLGVFLGVVHIAIVTMCRMSRIKLQKEEAKKAVSSHWHTDTSGPCLTVIDCLP